jgi:peroxiredoxin
MPSRVALRVILRVIPLSALFVLVFAAVAPADAGKRASFRLPNLDGRHVSPADFRGKVIVADFWATWCAPCFLQAEILHKAAAQYPKKDVQFLAIDVGEDEKTVRAFVTKRPFPYPVLLDEDEKLSGDLGVIAFPTLMVIDRRGEITYLKEGIVPAKQLRELLAQAGAPAPPLPAPTPTPAAARPAAGGKRR